uniref:Uncharacterized protein n=2 Tax=Plectus sambesii TaxID=2011161 RepID=A0A914UIH1_9BILA
MNIGLGGRGNHNDRGNSVRTYIKNGESKATITIVLTNEGDEAYDVNTYGNRITIERVISAASNAGSKYTIRGSKDNKVISTKKSDIDRILDRLNIQLENPVYWMSQDRSRQFLQEMKPAKLYQIFVHATELETMKNCYRRVMDYLNDFDQQLQLMAKRLPELEQKARTLKEIVKRHRNVNDERIQLNTFGWMILWIPVRDALHKRIDKEKKLEKAKDALEKLDAEVESITADKNKVEEEKAAAIAEIEELSGPTSSVAAQVTEKKQQVRVAFQRFKQAESQARDKNNEVRCRSQEMATVRKQLDKLLESGPSQTKDAAQKIQEDIERNEQEMLAASNGAE